MTGDGAPTRPDRSVRPRIGFFGELGSGNWGNDAGLDVILALIDQDWPHAELGFMSMGIPPIADRRGWPVVPLQCFEGYCDRVPWVPRRIRQGLGRVLDVVRIVRWPRHYDLVIIPGAGVLEDTTPVRPWGSPLNLLLLGIGARLWRTRLAYVAVGVSVPPHALSRRMFSWAARMAHYRSYRDNFSYESARELGVRVERDSVFTDLAFALNVPDTVVAIPSKPGSPIVTVGVMNYRGRAEDRVRAEELHQRYRRHVARLAGQVARLGCQVVLVTGDREDVPVARAIRDAVIQDQPRSSVRDASVGSMEELMQVLSGSRCVIASRFHNVLGALFMGIPTISLSYAAKNDAVMGRMGLGDFCQPIDAIDEDLFLEQFHRLQDEHEARSADIARRCTQERTLVVAQLDEVSRLIRDVRVSRG